MQCNVGVIDRVVRVLLSFIIGCSGLLLLPGPMRTALLISAGGLLLSAVVGWCPIYAPFKISTLKKLSE